MAPPPTPDELATLLQEVQGAFRPQLVPSDSPLNLDCTGTEKEVRLTALINCVGLRSLDELEDFVYLHGSGKLVPLDQADTAEDETQLVASPGKRAMRHQKRKEDLKTSRDEVKRTVVELNYSKETHGNDLRKLEDVSHELQVAVREKKELERRLEELNEEGGYREQLGSCYSIIDGLDNELRELQAHVAGVEQQRDSAVEAARESEAAKAVLEKEMDELLHRAMSAVQYVLAPAPSFTSLTIDVADPQGSSRLQRQLRSRTNPHFDNLISPVRSLSTPHRHRTQYK